MRAENQAGNIDTLNNSTHAWADQIDRGEMYQNKPEVITLEHVNVRMGSTYVSTYITFFTLVFMTMFHGGLHPDGDS